MKRGVWQAGGFPLDIPVLVLSEMFMNPTAAEPRLLKHTGRAIVFDSYADLKARIDDPALG